jgi:hypothetical protein
MDVWPNGDTPGRGEDKEIGEDGPDPNGPSMPTNFLQSTKFELKLAFASSMLPVDIPGETSNFSSGQRKLSSLDLWWRA